nr:stage III sporulation AC/AD family protein [Gemmiger formicilis]
MLPYAAQALEWLENFSVYLRREEFICLIRAAGIALVAQTAQDLCKDAGMTAMGAKVELAGRCMILLSALPMLQRVVDVWSRLLQ